MAIFTILKTPNGITKITAHISEKVQNIDALFFEAKQYSGRYLIIYIDEKHSIILPDALALRELYYFCGKSTVVCGSQPNLIAKLANIQIKGSSEDELVEFYNTHLKDGKWDYSRLWIGDDTIYSGIKHLLPNHYFDLNKLAATRFWPNRVIKTIPLNQAVDSCCKYLEGAIEAIVNRNDVMMAITAGMDSRTLLAASKKHQSKIYYFINNHGLGTSTIDTVVSKEICSNLGVKLHIHDNIPKAVDDNFEKIFLENTFFASRRILHVIYNVFYKHSDKINIIGIGEIGRTRFGKVPKNLNGYRLAYKLGYKSDKYAVDKCSMILSDMYHVYKKYNVNVMTGFYWEQMLGNWGATGNSESDIAIEEVNPINSHYLYEIFLSVDPKFTKYNDNILFKELIRKMWPDLLRWPFNPPENMIKKLVKSPMMYNLVKELDYQMNYLRWRIKYDKD